MEEQPGDKNSYQESEQLHKEETAAELTPAVPWERPAVTGIGLWDILGYTALAIAVLSFFFMPGILGIAATVLSIAAISKRSYMIGGWALSVALISLGWRFLFVPYI